MSLKYRIALVVFTLEIVMVSLVLWHTQRLSLKAQTEAFERHMDSYMGLISTQARHALIEEDYAEFQANIERLMDNPEILHVMLADHEGKVVVCSKAEHLGMPLALPPAREGSRWTTRPLANASGPVGALAMEFSTQTIEEAQGAVFMQGLLIALASMCVIAVVGLAIGHMLTRRLETLRRAAEDIALWRMDMPIAEGGSDEVAALARAMNSMRREIAHTIDTLSAEVMERMRTERELLDSREQYKLLADNIQEVFWLTAPGEPGRVIYVSPAYERIWGRRPEELYTDSGLWMRDIHPGDRALVAETFDRFVRGMGGETFEAEFRLIRPGGETVWIRDRGFAVRDEHGGLRSVCGVAMDVTARKEAMSRLRQSEQLLRTVTEHAPAYICEFGPGGEITYANRPFAGHTSEEVLGSGVWEWFGAEGDDGVREAVSRVFTEAGPVSLDASLEGRDMYVQMVPVGIEGAVASGVMMATDITDLKEVEEGIKRALLEKEVLLGEVHHRVKNNLALVSSLLQMQGLKARSEEARAALRQSRDRIFAMSHLHEMLYQGGDFASVDLRRYVQDLFSTLREAYGGDRVRLDLEIQDGVEGFHMDTLIPLGLMLSELITNALKHAFEAGRGGGGGTLGIWLGVLDRDEGAYMLRVRDDGPGLGIECANGTGTLGLGLVRALTRQLRGVVCMRDCRAGRGAEISIAFMARVV